MKKFNRVPKRQTGFMLRAICYTALVIFCFLDIKKMWGLLIIFLVLAAFYFIEWYKHRNDLSLSEIIKRNLNGEEYESSSKTKNESERKKSFQDYLGKIETDFKDDELDEMIKNEEEYDDLYIE